MYCVRAHNCFSKVIKFYRKKNTHYTPLHCILCHSRVENFLKRPVWSWRSEFVFSFGLAEIKNPLMLPATIYFWILMFSFLSSNNTPIKYYLCWICTSNKDKALKTIKFSFSAFLWNLLRSKFWNHFQAEIIPWSPIFLDYFPIVFHMVWKNQEEL